MKKKKGKNGDKKEERERNGGGGRVGMKVEGDCEKEEMNYI